MNCNLCPYYQLCRVQKISVSRFDGVGNLSFTTPANLEECPLNGVLKAEEDK